MADNIKPRPTIAVNPVKSNAISAYGYDAGTGILRVQFASGRQYDYEGVPPEMVSGLASAESIGRHLNQHIAGKFDTIPVEPPPLDENAG